jgi:hypothetical protein
MSLLQLPSECILSVLTRLPVTEVVAMASCCSGGCQIKLGVIRPSLLSLLGLAHAGR